MFIRDATEKDLPGILDLQQRNFKEGRSASDIAHEGFVTIHHTIDVLRGMNSLYPHTIAVDKGKVVGYALSMLPSLSLKIPELNDLFSRLGSFDSFVIMGQVCIERTYRRRGVFRSMYSFMADKFRSDFDHIITEVSEKNVRSLNAHLAIGFHEYMRHDEWVILVWEIGR